MDQAMDNLVEKFMTTWQAATLTDYAHVVLGLVLFAWFVSRFEK